MGSSINSSVISRLACEQASKVGHSVKRMESGAEPNMVWGRQTEFNFSLTLNSTWETVHGLFPSLFCCHYSIQTCLTVGSTHYISCRGGKKHSQSLEFLCMTSGFSSGKYKIMALEGLKTQNDVPIYSLLPVLTLSTAF